MRVKVEWWAFYLYSLAIGYACLMVLGPLDPTLFRDAPPKIRKTARRHAYERAEVITW
jgi:hypothetical protein